MDPFRQSRQEPATKWKGGGGGACLVSVTFTLASTLYLLHSPLLLWPTYLPCPALVSFLPMFL